MFYLELFSVKVDIYSLGLIFLELCVCFSTQVIEVVTGFRVRHILTAGSFGSGSTLNCVKIQNVNICNLSTTLLAIGFRNYKENNI